MAGRSAQVAQAGDHLAPHADGSWWGEHVEFSGEVSREDMVKDIEGLPGNLKVLDVNYEPNSYVIQTSGVREKIDHARSRLRKYKIFPIGRFAEWEYFNMDKAIESAMNCVESYF